MPVETIDDDHQHFRIPDTIEALPIETQEAFITLIQNRLREKRRTTLIETVHVSEADYAAGNVKRGSVADLIELYNCLRSDRFGGLPNDNTTARRTPQRDRVNQPAYLTYPHYDDRRTQKPS